jgi:hypothetical protein
MDCGNSRLENTLNHTCHCITLNRGALQCALDSAAVNITFPENCFAQSPVFISTCTLNAQENIIAAIERVVALPAYQTTVLAYAHDHAHFQPQNLSVFLGYDFHIDEQGYPRLIEINTNAGGALLNAFLLNAQIPCDHAQSNPIVDYAAQFVTMFEHEWQCVRGELPLRTIAIIDNEPQAQYLYAEFQLFAALFERQGIHTVICSPTQLRYDDAQLWHDDTIIDLVYNRLTDFSLSQPCQHALAQAYLNNHVVLTPHPRAYALYANKRNLAILSNNALLQSLDVDELTRQILVNGIAPTRCVDTNEMDDLWRKRKTLFFKPMTGYGSKAAYRGDKMTKRVFADILAADYVAQTFVAPSTRQLIIDGSQETFKVDYRAYVYAQTTQLTCARLYQGQTTNFRTLGGGFAPVISHFSD